MKVLIVDDYPSNLKLLRVQLEMAGYEVSEAANGAAALEKLGQEPVDAVISDVLMPVMDGFRLCNELRNNEATRHVPLILYTATYNSPSDRELAQSVGADAYILKPAPVNVLIDAIRAAQNRVPPRPPAKSPLDDVDILERYNAVLVRKLETRNAELQQALDKLNAAHAQILELNRNLETRVTQRTAALDAANRELEAFSFSVSHDLRAPLRHISGYAELIQAADLLQSPAEAQEIATRIVVAARYMNRLIEALLELAHIGRTPLELRPLELDQVLDEALEGVAPDTTGRRIEWRRGPLPRVLGDVPLLRQVLVNLLSNAIKYTRTREQAVIEIGHRPGRVAEVVVFVKDNGVGFDVGRAGELFGVFKRLHTAEGFEGTGIGLANAHRIISRHGGSIWADASVDNGATFFFSLRCA